MHRRTFLQTSAAFAGGALGALAFGPDVALGAGRPAIPAKISVQLYSLRSIFPNDFVGVLEALRMMGYEEVEFAGLHERDPAVVKAVLDDVGLAAPSAHVPIEAFEADTDAALAMARTLGHRYVIVPWLAENRRQSVDDYARFAAVLNRTGERARAQGMQLAYHNHDFEFNTFGGPRSGYDVLLAETDPALVAFQMDLFWVVTAGKDPVAIFEQHPGRFPLVHVKDRTAGGQMANVGEGAIDFRRIFAASERAGIRHAVIEHDNPTDPLAFARTSITNLRAMRG